VRDTPEPVPAAIDARSLFKDGKSAPDENAEPEDPEPGAARATAPQAPGDNLFSPDDADAAGANIFADEAAPQEPPVAPVEMSQPPLTQPTNSPPTADAPAEIAPKDASAPIASFSSRRTHDDASTPESSDHPVNRIAPRIDITPQHDLGETSAAWDEQPPQATPAPQLETPVELDAHIREEFLHQEDADNARSFALQPAIAGLVAKAARVLKPALALAKNAVEAVARIRTRPEAETPTDTPDTPDTVPDGALTGAKTGVQLSRIKAEWGAQIRIWTVGPGGKIRLRVVALLVAIGLIGAGYYAFVPRQQTTRDDTLSGVGQASLTRSAARGVRANNPARFRPSDFAAKLGTPAPNPALALIRPARRSVFEGKTDPNAGKPDTAKPAGNLSEAELAKIRASGLNVPTTEELAESGGDGEQQKIEAKTLADYKATGALGRVRTPPPPSPNQVRDDIFVAAIDRDLEANDAIILPDFSSGPQDDQPRARQSPLPADTVFSLDDQGFVIPTKKGALNPHGILVRLGKPNITPPTKPATTVLVPPDPLRARKPSPRPATLKTGADAIFVQGRFTLAQLTARRAKPRPISAQAELLAGDSSPSGLAVLTSYQPAARPSDFAKTVAKARVKLASATPATAPIINRGPVLPTRANVAKSATVKNAINLNRLNLIGVSGTPSKRRALLRMPSGRFVRVTIGDRVDGGRVAAIGVASLSYVKKGRNRVLKIPK